MSTRILLVDDSPLFLKFAALFLSQDSEMEIVGRALSGREALTQVERLHPDVVLMDVAMPEMDGLVATRQIKMLPGAPCVVILTFDDNPEYRAAAKTVGADGFVCKAQIAEELLPLIHTLFTDPEAKGELDVSHRALLPPLPTGPEAVPCLQSMGSVVRITMPSLLDPNGSWDAALAAGPDESVSKTTLNTDVLPAIPRVPHVGWQPSHGTPEGAE